MGIAVKEPQVKDLPENGLAPLPGEEKPVGLKQVGGDVQIGYLFPLQVLLHQNPLGTQFPVGLWDHDMRIVGEGLVETGKMISLVGEIHLPGKDLLEFPNHPHGIRDAEIGKVTLQLLSKIIEDVDIRFDGLFDARAPDLDDDLFAVLQNRPVHLRNGRRCQRFGVKGRKDHKGFLPPGVSENLLHHLKGKTRDPVLEPLKLLDILHRHQIWTGTQDLPQLDKGGTQFLHGHADSLGCGKDFLPHLFGGEVEELFSPLD